MLVSFLPAAGYSTASSRIRVYALRAALRKLDVESTIGYCSVADVLVVQKRLNPRIVELSAAFKAFGGLVVYDCEELGSALAYWAKDDELRAMFRIADIVTTNTDEFKAEFSSRFGANFVAIVPDTVDYFLEAPLPTVCSAGPGVQLLWFGHHSNIRMLLPYLDLFEKESDFFLTVCSGERGRSILGSRRRIRFITWSLAEFPRLLRSFHLTFLPHGEDKADRAKSNNRMITSVAWGVPAIVSRTPAYEETACLAGVMDSCFRTIEEAENCIVTLRSIRAREQYLNKAQSTIWSKHSPVAVATKWSKVISDFSEMRREQ
jgi:hypothetical protein